MLLKFYPYATAYYQYIIYQCGKFEMEIRKLRFPDLVGRIDYEWLRQIAGRNWKKRYTVRGES